VAARRPAPPHLTPNVEEPSASVRPGLAADIPVFDINRRQFVIDPSVHTPTAPPPVCTPADRHSRFRLAADQASKSSRQLPPERHPAVLPASTSLDDHIRLVEDRICELEASIGVPNSPRMSSSGLFNTDAFAVKQRGQLRKVPPTRRRRTLPPISVALTESPSHGHRVDHYPTMYQVSTIFCLRSLTVLSARNVIIQRRQQP